MVGEKNFKIIDRIKNFFKLSQVKIISNFCEYVLAYNRYVSMCIVKYSISYATDGSPKICSQDSVAVYHLQCHRLPPGHRWPLQPNHLRQSPWQQMYAYDPPSQAIQEIVAFVPDRKALHKTYQLYT